MAAIFSWKDMPCLVGFAKYISFINVWEDWGRGGEEAQKREWERI